MGECNCNHEHHNKYEEAICHSQVCVDDEKVKAAVADIIAKHAEENKNEEKRSEKNDREESKSEEGDRSEKKAQDPFFYGNFL